MPKGGRIAGLILAAILLAAVFLAATGGLSLTEPTAIWVLYLYGLGEYLGFDGMLFGASAVALLFLAWNPQLIRGIPIIPRRSLVLFAILTVLTVAYLASRARFMASINYLQYYVAIVVINSAIVIGLAFLLRRGLQTPRLSTSMAFHWLLFVWPCTYGFAWLHEAL